MFDEEYTSWARREHSNALLEVQRLESLMEDVSWYQFEIAAKGWQTPWHTSFPGSVVELYSQVYIDLGFREIGTFPVYYYGPVDSAPQVPPMIVYAELELARDLCRVTKEQLRNAYEWAPGGYKYETHSETSEGAKAYRLADYFLNKHQCMSDAHQAQSFRLDSFRLQYNRTSDEEIRKPKYALRRRAPMTRRLVLRKPKGFGAAGSYQRPSTVPQTTSTVPHSNGHAAERKRMPSSTVVNKSPARRRAQMQSFATRPATRCRSLPDSSRACARSCTRSCASS